MRVILTSNLKKLGKVGDLVNVKDGFARNYLFPKKKALRENKQNLQHFEKLREEIASKEKIQKENAEGILKELNDIKIEFVKDADDKDQLYGSVSVKDIQIFLLEKNIKINADDILLHKPIKTIGIHNISINPYDNLSMEVSIHITKSK